VRSGNQTVAPPGGRVVTTALLQKYALPGYRAAKYPFRQRRVGISQVSPVRRLWVHIATEVVGVNQAANAPVFHRHCQIKKLRKRQAHRKLKLQKA